MSKAFRPGIYFRGMAMGAADVVPGVSGGTMALITGVYEELIDTLGNIGFHLFGVWRREGFRAFWKAGNFTFLLTLVAGDFTAIALLARVINWLLHTYPVPVWAFFSGLILASIALVLRPLRRRGPAQALSFLVGLGLAVLIGLAPGLAVNGPSPLFFFFGGAIAICAMILPGISGSFILLLLGLYPSVLAAVEHAQLLLLGAFMIGCVAGLLSFVHVLKWLLHHHHDTVMALLGGFMAGSLVKLWPWRVPIPGTVRDHWMWPADYAQATQGPSFLGWAILMALVGLLIVWMLSRAEPVPNEAEDARP